MENCNNLKVVTNDFLVNNRADNYEDLIDMSHKLHMLLAHVDQFKDDMSA